MESELLREYLVIADEMNLTRAAERLHTTQSTLSKHVSVLEREFGATLLKRERRGLALTEAGALLYRRAANVVDLIDGLTQEIGRLGENFSVRVTGMLNNTDVVSLLSRVSRVLRDESNLSMALLPAPKTSANEAVVHGEADVAINHKGFSEELDPHLDRIDLYQEKLLILVENDHPLAEKESVTIEDLRDHRLVRISNGVAEFGWANIRRLCLAHGFEPRGVPLLIDSVIDCLTYPLDDAVLILQRGVFPLESFASGQRRCLPVVGDDAMFTVCAYCRKSERAHLEEFIATLKREAVHVGVTGPENRAARGKFHNRCKLLAQEADLNESETVAMQGFARGRSIDRIAEDLGLSRIMVGDLLASVYKKTGVRDRQALLDRIEAKELPW